MFYGSQANQHGFWALLFVALLICPNTVTASLQRRHNGTDGFHCEKLLRDFLEREDIQPGPPCAVPGNADLYGLGVRLGIYLTWFCSWIANNFVAEEMTGSKFADVDWSFHDYLLDCAHAGLDTNSIFLLALALCFTILTSMNDIYLVDNLILVQLSLGYIFGVMTLWGNRTRFYKKRNLEGAPHFGGWGTHCRLALCLTAASYSFWFWTCAVMDPTPDCFLREECGGLVLGLFTSSSVQGNIRIGNAAFSGACLLYYGAMTIIAMASFVRFLTRRYLRHEKVFSLTSYPYGKDLIHQHTRSIDKHAGSC